MLTLNSIRTASKAINACKGGHSMQRGTDNCLAGPGFCPTRQFLTEPGSVEGRLHIAVVVRAALGYLSLSVVAWSLTVSLSCVLLTLRI